MIIAEHSLIFFFKVKYVTFPLGGIIQLWVILEEELKYCSFKYCDFLYTTLILTSGVGNHQIEITPFKSLSCLIF